MAKEEADAATAFVAARRSEGEGANARTGPFSRADIARDAGALGLRRGDLVYVRASIRAVGDTVEPKADALLGGLIDAVGEEGGLIAPAFCAQRPIWARAPVYGGPDAKPITGYAAAWLLARPDAVRSPHPTHAFVGVGARGAAVAAHHPSDGACFEPLRALVEGGGKILVVGVNPKSPGFPTVHLAQWDLGLSKRHYLRYVMGVDLMGEHGVRRFRRNPETPGCSRGFGHFYEDHVHAGNLRTGHVGAAFSLVADAGQAYRTERAILEKNPRYALCDRPECLRCNVLCGYNLAAAPRALLAKAMAWARKPKAHPPKASQNGASQNGASQNGAHKE